jgi:hypothetical protein
MRRLREGWEVLPFFMKENKASIALTL